MATMSLTVPAGFPRNVPCPGEMLVEEFLKPAKTTQAALSQALGWTKTKLNQIARGKRAITADAALQLAAHFKNSPEYWLNLQAMYDLDRALADRERRWHIHLFSIRDTHTLRAHLQRHSRAA